MGNEFRGQQHRELLLHWLNTHNPYDALLSMSPAASTIFFSRAHLPASQHELEGLEDDIGNVVTIDLYLFILPDEISSIARCHTYSAVCQFTWASTLSFPVKVRDVVKVKFPWGTSSILLANS